MLERQVPFAPLSSTNELAEAVGWQKRLDDVANSRTVGTKKMRRRRKLTVPRAGTVDNLRAAKGF